MLSFLYHVHFCLFYKSKNIKTMNNSQVFNVKIELVYKDIAYLYLIHFTYLFRFEKQSLLHNELSTSYLEFSYK